MIYLNTKSKVKPKTMPKAEREAYEKWCAKYDIKQKGASTFVETFTDAVTKNVRQNERTLFMDSEEAILKVAQQCGFSQHGKINMAPINDDEFQNIYVLV